MGAAHASQEEVTLLRYLQLGCLLRDWEHERQRMHHEHSTAVRRRGVRGDHQNGGHRRWTPSAVALPEM